MDGIPTELYEAADPVAQNTLHEVFCIVSEEETTPGQNRCVQQWEDLYAVFINLSSAFEMVKRVVL